MWRPNEQDVYFGVGDYVNFGLPEPTKLSMIYTCLYCAGVHKNRFDCVSVHSHTSAMSFLLYFQVGKSPVTANWNLFRY